MEQRKAVYEDLLSALHTMRIVNGKTPTANVFHAMWLLENKQLALGFNINVIKLPLNNNLIRNSGTITAFTLFTFQTKSNFVSIAEVLLQTFENDIEVYWIAKEFHSYALVISADLENLKDLSIKLLEKEDTTVYKFVENRV